MIKTLVIDVPKARNAKEPRRRGSNSLGGETVVSVRYGQYDKAEVERAATALGMSLSEFVREVSLRCAKAYNHGTPSSHPFSRAYTEGPTD